MPDCPPVKSVKVENALCELFYPFGCGCKCKNLYKRWMKTEAEVKRLESEAEEQCLRLKKHD